MVLSLQAEDVETGLTIDPPSPAPAPDTNLVNVERAEWVRSAELRYGGQTWEVEVEVADGPIDGDALASAYEPG